MAYSNSSWATRTTRWTAQSGRRQSLALSLATPRAGETLNLDLPGPLQRFQKRGLPLPVNPELHRSNVLKHPRRNRRTAGPSPATGLPFFSLRPCLFTFKHTYRISPFVSRNHGGDGSTSEDRAQWVCPPRRYQLGHWRESSATRIQRIHFDRWNMQNSEADEEEEG